VEFVSGVSASKTGGDRGEGALPGFIEPALATSIEKVPSGGRWIHEIKFDGYRVQVHLVNEAVTVFTRRGHDWAQRFKKVAHDAWRIRASWALVDGEIVVPAADGTTDFSVLQNELKGSSNPSERRRSQAPVGPDGPFGEHADLTADLGSTQTNGESHPQVESPQTEENPSWPADKAAERKATLAYEREQKRRHCEREREESARQKERDRRQQHQGAGCLEPRQNSS
jgi:hypothetical protein